MDRRSFLAHFGVGAAIVPLIAGIPVQDAAAQLITVPEVRPVELAAALAPYDVSSAIKSIESGQAGEIVVYYKAADGHTWSFRGASFLLKHELKMREMKLGLSHYPRLIARTQERLEWTITGLLVQDGMEVRLEH